MAEKQSILGRMSQLIKANINSLLDRAEDPEKMLDQLIRDFGNNIAEAETSVAQTIGNLRLAERDHDEDLKAAQDWGQKAKAASDKADSCRASGDAAGADKWDNLARVALGKQIDYEKQAKDAEPMIASQTEMVDKLKAGLEQMKSRMEELKEKRDSLVARQKTARAQQQVQQAVAQINVMDPTSDLARFEERVRREEAMAQGQAELAASSLDSAFDELGDASKESEVAARLAALKQQ